MPRENGKHDDGKSARVSVSLTAEQHATLTEIARDHRVSLAWVVRAAVEEYITKQAPLFRKEL